MMLHYNTTGNYGIHDNEESDFKNADELIRIIFQPYWRSWQEISDKLLCRMDLSNKLVSYMALSHDFASDGPVQ